MSDLKPGDLVYYLSNGGKWEPGRVGHRLGRRHRRKILVKFQRGDNKGTLRLTRAWIRTPAEMAAHLLAQ